MRFLITPLWSSLALTLVCLSNATPVGSLALFGVNRTSLHELQAWFAPSVPKFNFWDEATALGANFPRYNSELFHNISAKGEDIAGRVTLLRYEIGEALSSVVPLTALLQNNVTVDRVTREDISREVAQEFAVILEYLQEAFPPPSEAEHHAQREQIVREALSRTEEALVRVLTKHGVAEADVRLHCGRIMQHIEKAIVVLGDLAEQHPDIVAGVVMAVAGIAVGYAIEAWLARPLLGMLGWGPYGPIEGTAASFLQSRCWGATVKAGSWFSTLQRAGMKGYVSGIGSKIGAGIGTGIAIGVGVGRSCCSG